MNEQAQYEDAFTIERVYPNCRDHVWAAWADAEMKRKWFGNGFISMEFRVGGTERGAFSNDMGEHTKNATYFEIKDKERIVYAYSMAMNGTVHTVSLATILFADEGGGTRLTYKEQMCIIPPSDGAEGRKHGWGALLDALAGYLEADTLAASQVS